MENKKAKKTKKEIIVELIDILKGDKEVEDIQEYVDFLQHEYELLEKKSSKSTQTKNQKDNEVLKDKIVETLRNLENQSGTITDIQNENEELGQYSNQKMSALLTQLVNDKIVARVPDKKKTYFQLV